MTNTSKCYVCGYSLLGLPEHGRCPECGFAFDEDTRIWFSTERGSQRNRLYIVLLWAAIGIPTVLSIIAIVLIQKTSQRVALSQWSIGAVSAAFAAVAMGCSTLWSYWTQRQPPFVVVNPDGLLVNKSGRHADHALIPWQELPSKFFRGGVANAPLPELMVVIGVFLRPEDAAALKQAICRKLHGMGPSPE